MKEFLSHHGVAFTVRLVDEDPAAFAEMAERTGSRSTPTTLIGDEVVVGFDRKRLGRLLGLNGKEKAMEGKGEEKVEKKRFAWLGSIFSGFMSSA